VLYEKETRALNTPSSSCSGYQFMTDDLISAQDCCSQQIFGDSNFDCQVTPKDVTVIFHFYMPFWIFSICFYAKNLI
jgi:hypothetical protein